MNNNEIDNEIDDLLDNFDFKPITDGLGFHHSLKEKKQIKTDLSIQSEALKKELETRVDLLSAANDQTKDTSSIHRGDLAPFYASELEEKKVSEIELGLEPKEEIQKVKAPSMFIRFSAWAVDLFILALLMFITFSSILLISEVPLETLSLLMLNDEIITSIAFISLMFYVFYFSFFDKTTYSSLGKNIFNLQVKHVNKSKRLGLIQVFMRTLITVISLPLLGLPIALNIHNKLTDTKVVTV